MNSTEKRDKEALTQLASSIAFRCPKAEDFVHFAAIRLAGKLRSSDQHDSLLTRVYEAAKNVSASDSATGFHLYLLDQRGAQRSEASAIKERAEFKAVLKEIAHLYPDRRISHPFIVRQLQSALNEEESVAIQRPATPRKQEMGIQ